MRNETVVTEKQSPITGRYGDNGHTTGAPPTTRKPSRPSAVDINTCLGLLQEIESRHKKLLVSGLAFVVEPRYILLDTEELRKVALAFTHLYSDHLSGVVRDVTYIFHPEHFINEAQKGTFVRQEVLRANELLAEAVRVFDLLQDLKKICGKFLTLWRDIINDFDLDDERISKVIWGISFKVRKDRANELHTTELFLAFHDVFVREISKKMPVGCGYKVRALGDNLTTRIDWIPPVEWLDLDAFDEAVKKLHLAYGEAVSSLPPKRGHGYYKKNRIPLPIMDAVEALDFLHTLTAKELAECPQALAAINNIRAQLRGGSDNLGQKRREGQGEAGK